MSVTLEQVQSGYVKTISYERNILNAKDELCKQTKIFTLKIRKGELDGRRYEYPGMGDEL